MVRDLDRFTRTGHLCLALDPARLLPMEELLARVEELLAAIKGVPVRDGFAEVLLPGERRDRLARESARTGVLPSTVVRDGLERTARSLGVPVPW
jgi:LDH2 family malate/lactate/ureidoglycolate dehydrogenase